MAATSKPTELQIYLTTPDLATQKLVHDAIGTHLDEAMQGKVPSAVKQIPLKTYTLAEIEATTPRRTEEQKSAKQPTFTVVGPTEYDIAAMPAPGTQLERNKIYINKDGQQLKCTVLDPVGNPYSIVIETRELKSLNAQAEPTIPLLIELLSHPLIKQNFPLDKTTGMDVLLLHQFPLGMGCTTQVASQFNRLESKFAQYVASVWDWITDVTQGPRASLQSKPAALHRYAHYQDGKTHALTEIFSKCTVKNAKGKVINIIEKYNAKPSGEKLYENGYLQLWAIPDTPEGNADLAVFEDHILKNINQLTMLLQWTDCSDEKAKVIAQQLQVFCAAPSFQGHQYEPRFDKICKALVVGQYKATARLAAIRSKQTGMPEPLHLTLVGQGAFNNPPEIMRAAMQAVNEEVAGTDVAIYLHGYSLADVVRCKEACKGLQIAHINADDFKKLPHPATLIEQRLADILTVVDFYCKVRNGDWSEKVKGWEIGRTKRSGNLAYANTQYQVELQPDGKFIVLDKNNNYSSIDEPTRSRVLSQLLACNLDLTQLFNVMSESRDRYSTEQAKLQTIQLTAALRQAIVANAPLDVIRQHILNGANIDLPMFDNNTCTIREWIEKAPSYREALAPVVVPQPPVAPQAAASELAPAPQPPAAPPVAEPTAKPILQQYQRKLLTRQHAFRTLSLPPNDPVPPTINPAGGAPKP